MRLQEFVLKGLRKIYTNTLKEASIELSVNADSNDVSAYISKLVLSDHPFMIARFGATELACVKNYLGVIQNDRNIFRFISGKSLQWWWSNHIIQQLKEWSGFFPTEIHLVEKFCRTLIDDSSELDMLASWLKDEYLLKDKFALAELVKGIYIEPFWSAKPWTKALSGKKVLVIHPFADQIEQQYQKREFLFTNPDILPSFQLSTIKAIQSLGGETNGFKDWFEALEWMKTEMDKTDYEICLIGAGAYGFPLAAHAKRTGKKAIHLGGVLQLLFGIIGKRWENPDYNKDYNYSALINEHWVRPRENLKPKNAESVEGACYW